MKRFIWVLVTFFVCTACTTNKGAEDATKEATEEVVSLKVDEKEDWVIERDILGTLSDEDQQILEQTNTKIRLPKVNMDSPYAHYINEYLVEKTLSDTISNAKTFLGAEAYKWQELDYHYTEHQGVISLWIENKIDMGETKLDDVLEIFHFDTQGNKLGLEDILKRFEYPLNIKEQLKRKIRLFWEQEQERMKLEHGESSKFAALSTQELTEEIDHLDSLSHRLQYFLDEEGKVHIVVNSILNYSSRTEVPTITLDKTIEEAELNPLFVKLNIKEDKAYGIYYVGPVYDEDSLNNAALQTMAFYREQNLEMPWLGCQYVQPYFLEGSIGSELYLIVPKYRSAIVRTYGQEMTEEDGKMEQIKPYNEITLGDTLVFCNPSDLYSNIVVELEQDGKVYRFSPQMSLKDGNLLMEKEGQDINQSIKMLNDFPTITEGQVRNITNQLIDVIPKG